jgi:hypothetical protein
VTGAEGACVGGDELIGGEIAGQEDDAQECTVPKIQMWFSDGGICRAASRYKKRGVVSVVS